MRLAVTRPQADGDRTATALRARGHQVLVAPLMRVEPVVADLAGGWGAVIITSANAPGAIVAHPARAALSKLPVFAVGRRSAEAARQAGFSEVATAGGDVRDLVRLIAERQADAAGPLLYLAGEDRAADLTAELAAHGIAAEMRVVYRAVAVPFPLPLVAALKAGEIDAVLAVRHLCLSSQIAEPLTKAGAAHIAVAARPDEAALIDLVS
jgi:uroporphyrinogen-III synthase